jgi:hypothetical protein
LGHVALAIWFAYWAWQALQFYFVDFPRHLDMLGFDARIYLHGAQTWLAGGDPWTAYATRHSWPHGAADGLYYFAGPPPTVLAFVPFAALSDGVFGVIWGTLTVGAAVYTVRRLRLPIYWLMFPPLAQGIFVGNPQVVCLALLLSSSTLLRALAAPMKAYAVIPMVALRQWRPLAVLCVAGALSIVLFLPLWMTYAHDFPHVQAWIQDVTRGGFSAARDPRLFALTASSLIALALVDRRAAGWLAVPALWPASEFFYSAFALPLRCPWLAVMLAVQAPQAPQASTIVPWAVIVYAFVRVSGCVFSALWRRGRLTEGMNVVHAGVADVAGRAIW